MLGLFRVCTCSLLLIASASLVGACSGDDDGGSSGGGACHCEFVDHCDEQFSYCESTECEHNGENALGSGACDQTDVIASCDCPSQETVTYYRSSYSGDPQEDCEFFCDDAVYTAR